jgi:hypothetical protein
MPNIDVGGTHARRMIAGAVAKRVGPRLQVE